MIRDNHCRARPRDSGDVAGTSGLRSSSAIAQRAPLRELRAAVPLIITIGSSGARAGSTPRSSRRRPLAVVPIVPILDGCTARRMPDLSGVELAREIRAVAGAADRDDERLQRRAATDGRAPWAWPAAAQAARCAATSRSPRPLCKCCRDHQTLDGICADSGLGALPARRLTMEWRAIKRQRPEHANAAHSRRPFKKRNYGYSIVEMSFLPPAPPALARIDEHGCLGDALANFAGESLRSTF